MFTVHPSVVTYVYSTYYSWLLFMMTMVVISKFVRIIFMYLYVCSFALMTPCYDFTIRCKENSCYYNIGINHHSLIQYDIFLFLHRFLRYVPPEAVGLEPFHSSAQGNCLWCSLSVILEGDEHAQNQLRLGAVITTLCHMKALTKQASLLYCVINHPLFLGGGGGGRRRKVHIGNLWPTCCFKLTVD